MFYSYNNRPYALEGGALRELASYDEARKSYGDQVGLSNDDVARYTIIPIGAPPILAPPPPAPPVVVTVAPPSTSTGTQAFNAPPASAVYAPPAGLPREGSPPLTPYSAPPTYTLPPSPTYAAPLSPTYSTPPFAGTLTAPAPTTWPYQAGAPAATAQGLPAVPSWMLYAGGGALLLLVLVMRGD